MNRAIRSDIARPVIQQLEAAGYAVDVIPLTGRTKGTWEQESDMPGLRLEASRGGKLAASYEVRDWSRERVEIEAACMLAHMVGIAIASDADSAGRRRVA